MTPRTARRFGVAVTFAVAGYYALWGGEYSAFDLVRLRKDIAAANEELAHTRRRGAALEVQAGRLENDPETIERVARERFGMIRDGEILVRFVGVDTTSANAERLAQTP